MLLSLQVLEHDRYCGGLGKHLVTKPYCPNKRCIISLDKGITGIPDNNLQIFYIFKYISIFYVHPHSVIPVLNTSPHYIISRFHKVYYFYKQCKL